MRPSGLLVWEPHGPATIRGCSQGEPVVRGALGGRAGRWVSGGAQAGWTLDQRAPRVPAPCRGPPAPKACPAQGRTQCPHLSPHDLQGRRPERLAALGPGGGGRNRRAGLLLGLVRGARREAGWALRRTPEVGRWNSRACGSWRAPGARWCLRPGPLVPPRPAPPASGTSQVSAGRSLGCLVPGTPLSITGPVGRSRARETPELCSEPLLQAPVPTTWGPGPPAGPRRPRTPGRPEEGG